MDKKLEKQFEIVMETMRKAGIYQHAVSVLQYDMETICPPKAMEEQGEVSAFLGTEAFRLYKDEKFIKAAEYCYKHRFGSGSAEAPGEDGLSEMQRTLIEAWNRENNKTKNVTPETNHRWEMTANRAYVRWLEAKEKNSFAHFAPSLKEVCEMCGEQVSLREEKCADPYDELLNDYERGISQHDIDEWFGECKERLLPMLEKIRGSKKVIRTDFLSRPTEIWRQENVARQILLTNGYDFSRGAFTTTEHPFMDGLARNDIRVTTHYYPEMFASNIFSIAHEGGHALFGQNIPEECYDYFIDDNMTMGMHESVSRFYENRIARSRAYISLIYPLLRENMPETLAGVTEEELYEAVNVVNPSLIRIEADEFTYTLHIIIRYEIEKMIMHGELPVEKIPEVWNAKYEEYLGVRPENDSEGALQDVHWTFGLGYFPTYALGNMYNAMYFNRMKQEIDVDGLIRAGKVPEITAWMKENVFARACHLEPKEWIREICGREITPDDFLTYLEEKYGELYGIG